MNYHDGDRVTDHRLGGNDVHDGITMNGFGHFRQIEPYRASVCFRRTQVTEYTP